MDFFDIEDKEPAQEFYVPQGREIGEYAVKFVHVNAVLLIADYNLPHECRMSKFSSVSSLTIFIPASQGESVTRIYYIGLRGNFSEVRLHNKFYSIVIDPRSTFPEKARTHNNRL